MESESNRLPRLAEPEHYTLELNPDFNLNNFTGKCVIDILIIAGINQLPINSVDLTLKHAELYCQSNPDRVISVTIIMDEKKEIALFKFNEYIPRGKVVLTIQFMGNLNDRLVGFYRTSTGAATQFEEIHARKCFPCFDEPCYRTTFDVVLTVPLCLTALSNMPPLEDLVENSQRIIRFQRTPLMPTYILAIVIGEFDYIERETRDKIPVRVYTPKGRTDQGQLALEACLRMLVFLEDYLGVPYPLPKLDLIAISDFLYAAMENWGLITFRESILLVDNNSCIANIKGMYNVLCHEVAHLWFGDLVTVYWWHETWIKEGFATFLQTFCCIELFPEYDFMATFVNDTMFCGLAEDELPEDTDDHLIPEDRPIITTCLKGAVILRMIRHQIGDEAFRKALNLFLTVQQFAAGTTYDVWNCFDEVSSEPFGTMMDTWTCRRGFPLVSVRSEPKNDGRMLFISQKRFKMDASENNKEEYWTLPISVIGSRSPSKPLLSALMDCENLIVTLPGVMHNDWIKLNPATVGFYRILYTPDDLQKLDASIKDRTLPTLDRTGVLNDVYATAKAGYVPVTMLLQLMESFTEETEYVTCRCLIDCLKSLRELITNTPFVDKFDTFALRLLKTIRCKASWDIKPEDEVPKRLATNLILPVLVMFKDKQAHKEAYSRFLGHVKGTKPMSPDLWSAGFAAAMSNDCETDLYRIIQWYRKTYDRNCRDLILSSFGHLQSPSLINRVLDFLMSKEVKKENVIRGLCSIVYTPIGRQTAWMYFVENKERFIAKFNGTTLLAISIAVITRSNACTGKAKMIRKYFVQNPIEGIEQLIANSLKIIQQNYARLTRDRDLIEKYLDKSNNNQLLVMI